MSDSMLTVSSAPEVGSTAPAAGEGPTGPELPEFGPPEGAGEPPAENPTAADTDAIDAVTEPEAETSTDDDTPADSGVGEDDKLFFGKYKSYEEAEKGFKELQSKLREKAPEAPEEYNFDLSKDEAFVSDLGEDLVNEFNPKEDPRFSVMEEIFKKHNISQEAVDDIVKAQIRFDASLAPDLDAEAKALGDEREIIMANANHFVQKHLNAEEQEIAVTLGQSAAGVKLLYKMSQMAGEKPIPTKVESAEAGPSSSELYAQAFAYKDGVDNFENNEGAKARYDSMIGAAVKREASEKAGR